MPMYINELYMYTIIVLCKLKKNKKTYKFINVSSMKILAKCLCSFFIWVYRNFGLIQF